MNVLPRLHQKKSKLAQLPTEQREQLEAWFASGVTYNEIRDRLKAQFGVQSSRTAIARHYAGSFQAAAAAGVAEALTLRLQVLQKGQVVATSDIGLTMFPVHGALKNAKSQSFGVAFYMIKPASKTVTRQNS